MAQYPSIKRKDKNDWRECEGRYRVSGKIQGKYHKYSCHASRSEFKKSELNAANFCSARNAAQLDE